MACPRAALPCVGQEFSYGKCDDDPSGMNVLICLLRPSDAARHLSLPTPLFLVFSDATHTSVVVYGLLTKSRDPSILLRLSSVWRFPSLRVDSIQTLDYRIGRRHRRLSLCTC